MYLVGIDIAKYNHQCFIATTHGEVMDFNNFSNPAKLIAFSGFDIAIYQSGESLSYGKLVKRGSSLQRQDYLEFSLRKYSIDTWNNWILS